MHVFHFLRGVQRRRALRNSTKVSLLSAAVPPPVPRLSAINRAISGRAAEEGDRTEKAKQRHFVKAAQESRLHEIGVEGRMDGGAGIDQQSQSSGFHVSRCQVSAIGPA